MFLLFAQVFSVLLASISVSKSYVDVRSKRESVPMFFFWTLTWLAIVTVALFPTIVDKLIEMFGRGRTGIGTFLGIGLVFLYFIVYRIYTKLEQIEKKLTKVVQEIAFRDESTRRL